MIQKKEQAFEKCSMEVNPQRRKHLYRGMEKKDYHKFFDKAYNMMKDWHILQVNSKDDADED